MRDIRSHSSHNCSFPEPQSPELSMTQSHSPLRGQSRSSDLMVNTISRLSSVTANSPRSGSLEDSASPLVHFTHHPLHLPPQLLPRPLRPPRNLRVMLQRPRNALESVLAPVAHEPGAAETYRSGSEVRHDDEGWRVASSEEVGKGEGDHCLLEGVWLVGGGR